MLVVTTVVCLVLAAVVVVLTGVRAAQDRPIAPVHLAAAAALELAVLVYVGVRVAQLVDGHRPHSTGLAVAYLIGTVLVMPAATALGIIERSRWGPVVVGVGALVVCVLFARIGQVWSGG